MGDAATSAQVPDVVPRCAVCGHRRIFHHAMLSCDDNPYRTREHPVPCSMPRCRCRRYDPVGTNVEAVGAESSAVRA